MESVEYIFTYNLIAIAGKELKNYAQASELLHAT